MFFLTFKWCSLIFLIKTVSCYRMIIPYTMYCSFDYNWWTNSFESVSFSIYHNIGWQITWLVKIVSKMSRWQINVCHQHGHWLMVAGLTWSLHFFVIISSMSIHPSSLAGLDRHTYILSAAAVIRHVSVGWNVKECTTLWPSCCILWITFALKKE